MLFPALTIGACPTVTVTGVTAETHPVPVHVILATPFPEFPVMVPPKGFGMIVFPAMSCAFVI